MKGILSIFILLVSISISGQEICNNSIDDDGDGLIDLNDIEDCKCSASIPSGLIPNPSFEDMLCCPTQKEELDCAVSWIQASAATSDYLHNCGITTHPNVNKTPPQPIPDGDGYIGFRDSHSGNENYKEYVGACLNETMEVGKEYRLDFFLGFAPEIEQSIEMTIYGTTECSNIPFGGNNSSIGCPTNVAGWTQLGQQYITGQNEWKNVIFDIIADKPYNVIVLGPGCDVQSNIENNWYFYADRLALAELADFDLPFAEIQGSLCDGSLSIIAPDEADYSYQWFKDGVALMGETDINLDLTVDQASVGFYEVMITTPDGCYNSEEFDLIAPVFETSISESICEGESFIIDGNEYNTEGQHQYSLISSLGCDSMVTVNLEVLPLPFKMINPIICEGEEYSYAGQIFTEAGSHTLTISNGDNCDSLININLSIDPKYDNMFPISICDDQSIQQGMDELSTTGVYQYTYQTQYGCDSLVTIDLTVNESYNVSSYMTICEGESYTFGNQTLTEGGLYTESLSSALGCDSLVNLELDVVNITTENLSETICKDEEYTLLNQVYTEEGIYVDTTQNSNGCDSIIFLNLTKVIWEDGITLPADTTVLIGQNLSIAPIYVAPEFQQIVWTNELGEVLSNEDILNLESIIGRQNITVTAVDQYGCVDFDQINISINRNVEIHTPNVFSPNGDGSNDYFKPTTNQSITALKEMMVYDRWGNLVYNAKSIVDLGAWKGWDGMINGQKAITGVYVYVAIYTALDGKEEIISGDITIVR